MSDLTTDEAEALVVEIRATHGRLAELVRQAWDGRAWRALGYPTWGAFCEARLGDIALPRQDRPLVVRELVDAGLSNNAIAAAVGCGETTVRRDLRQTANLPPSTGSDGREYPRQRPTADPLAQAGEHLARVEAQRATSVVANEAEALRAIAALRRLGADDRVRAALLRVEEAARQARG